MHSGITFRDFPPKENAPGAGAFAWTTSLPSYAGMHAPAPSSFRYFASSASSASAPYTLVRASRMMAGCTATERFFSVSNQ